MNVHYNTLLIVLATLTVCECSCGGTNWPEFAPDEMDCPSDDVQLVSNFIVPWGVANRAWKTVPKEIEIRKGNIKNSGLGAFAKTFIPMNTWLGEYEGELFGADEEEYITPYCWQVFRNDSLIYYIDGAKIETSNWLRWVNCPRTAREENVWSLYCLGKVYYITSKPIYPGQELFVYYGAEYAQLLGIDITEFGDSYEEEEEEKVDYFDMLGIPEGFDFAKEFPDLEELKEEL